MTCKTSYEFHHNFAKLADESGFSFNTHRPRVHIDWNKIKLLDVDSLVRDRKFILIEQYLNQILDCVLESEFDVRILDEGVVKMFRLAQLTVEYQQFCRHYLDRSMLVLSDELKAVRQELEASKKKLSDREDEIKKLKRRTKHNYRPPLLYGNDNIANMILKTLSNRGDVYSNNTVLDSGLHYNKCNYCDKVFLNQLYLKGHISRRHPTMVEMPEKDSTDCAPVGQDKHSENNSEINELKRRLEEMESQLLKATSKLESGLNNDDKQKDELNVTNTTTKESKDAETSVNNESYLLEKLEEWKKDEAERHNAEIHNLKTHLLETINSLQDKDSQHDTSKEREFIRELHKTIEEQKEELTVLKKELASSLKNSEDDNKNDVEKQISFWSHKVQEQSNQYKMLLQNLNEVAKEAQEARALAQAESMRASELQSQLQHIQMSKKISVSKKPTPATRKRTITNDLSNHSKKVTPVLDRKSLEELHRKAQTLLNMNTSDSSENSNSISQEETEVQSEEGEKPKRKLVSQNNFVATPTTQELKPKIKKKNNVAKKTNVTSASKISKHRKTKLNGVENKVPQEVTLPVLRSPIKVVRAKITEEVNNRLTSAGVDPLRKGVNEASFKKQRALLVKEQRLKAKQKTAYERVRYRILSYLDAKAGIEKDCNENSSDSKSPSKQPKVHRLSSMIHNVKKKAMSFVKSTDSGLNRMRNEAALQNTESSVESPQRFSTDNKNIRAKQITTYLQNTKFNVNNESLNNNIDETLHILRKQPIKKQMTLTENIDELTDSNTDESDSYEKPNVMKDETAISINKLIDSPIRRPSTANGSYGHVASANRIRSGDLDRAQSETDLLRNKETIGTPTRVTTHAIDVRSEKSNTSPIKANSEEVIHIGPKGVLKNAPSTSSLNKKKVLFDMDAIQMKSVSASPSQSLTEKSDGNEKYELGLINLDNDEWDISSIDDEPLKMPSKNAAPLPKVSTTIAELRQSIESQLSRRTTPSTLVVGGVDMLRGPAPRAASVGGSNTSLGSSVFDDTDEAPPPLHSLKTFANDKTKDKDDSEIDISEFSLDVPVEKKRNL